MIYYTKDNEMQLNDGSDILIVTKKDNILTGEQLMKSTWKFSHQLYIQCWEDDYEEKGSQLKEDVVLTIGNDWSWDDDKLRYPGREFRICSTPYERLCYICANIYDDHLIEEMVKKHLPNVKDIFISGNREVKAPYLRYWMDKYNFTLEDFWLNNKYIVFDENPCGGCVFDMLVNYDMIDFDKIDYTSEDACLI